MADLLQSCNLKLHRANEHIGDLDGELAAYYARKPYESVPYRDPQTGQMVYRFQLLQPPDPQWSLLIGDAVHNLRSTLDHLVCALIELNKRKVGDGNDFPVADSKGRFDDIVAGKIQGTRANQVRPLLEAMEPYRGGKGEWIWKLHKLDVTDKHRRLLLGFAVSLMVSEYSERVFHPEANVFIKTGSSQSTCVKDGAVLSVPVENTKSDRKQVMVHVALNEPGILECEPVLPTLVKFRHQIERTIEAFVTAFPRLR